MAKKIEVFASEAQQGELENFPDIKRGWGITKSKTGGIPPMKWYNAMQNRTDEAINQVAKESINGYTFKDGGVAESQNDWFEHQGNFYYRKSGFPHAVKAGKTPETDGGIWSEATPDGLWAAVVLWSDLNKSSGASMIGAKNGGAVQDNIDELNKTTELIKNNVDGYQCLSDIETNKTSTTSKMIIKRSDGGIFILTKNNDGYVRYYMKDNEGDAVPDKSLFRVLDVAQYANVLVSTNSKPTTNEGGKLYVDRGNAILSHFTKFGNSAIPETFITSTLEAATLGSGQKCSYKFKTFSSAASITLYASSASTFNAKIVIKSSNGVTEVIPVAIGYSSNAGILHIPVAVPYSETVDNEVEIIIQNGGTTALYVLGVNLIELSSATKGMSVGWAIGFSDTSSKSYQGGLGASDYAFFDSDSNRWVGSYHGYETRNQPIKFLCDRVELDIPALPTDAAVIAKNIIIKQDNRLNGKIDIYSEHSFSDNAMNMQVIMRNGAIKCNQAYICMNTTNPTYKNIDYPIIYNSSSPEDKYFNRKTQSCTQSNEETGQSVDVSHTLLWGEKTSQYVRFEGNYSKYYYGLIVNGSQDIKDLSWRVKKTYTR